MNLKLYNIYYIFMYSFFLSNVDNNSEYDNLHMKSIDEEDKYFDSESPIEGTPVIKDDSDTEHPIESDDKDDGLDTYMNMLKKNEITVLQIN